MQEEWKVIDGFPKYQVSNFGNVASIKSGRILRQSHNQQGHHKVNLTQNGVTYTRNVNHLVAAAFLSEPDRDDHISLIHRNGVKADCRADNLLWRPRHFAIKYHQQFEAKLFKTSKMSIEDIKSGAKYKRIQDAVVEHGLLFNDIIISMHERTYVWPTYQQFRVLPV